LGAGHNEWPMWVGASMYNWCPPEVATRYGTEASSMVNGIWLEFDLMKKDNILAALRRRGYSCVKDQELINSIAMTDTQRDEQDRSEILARMMPGYKSGPMTC
jgi:hypothetical protein